MRNLFIKKPMVVTANLTHKGTSNQKGPNHFQQPDNRSFTNSYQQSRNHVNRYQNNWGNCGHQSPTANT